MEAPAASSSCGDTPLTAPRVPTGMNAGVSTTPWGVVSRPRRASPRVASTSNRNAMAGGTSALRLRRLLTEVDDPRLDPFGEPEHEAVLGDARVLLHLA